MGPNRARLGIWPALAALYLLAACSSGGQAGVEKPGVARHPKTVAEVAPLTAANLRGHKALYDEGWWIVTSSKETFQYAYRHSVVTSGEALAEAGQSVAQRSAAVGPGITSSAGEALGVAAAIQNKSARFARVIAEGGHGLGKAQMDYGIGLLETSWDFVKGGIYYGKRTRSDWESLTGTWPQYYRNLKKDFSNILELNHQVASRFSTEIEADWGGSFDRAVEKFNAEYEESGTRSNSLSALGDIFQGWGKLIYEGGAKPSARSVFVAAIYGAQGVTYVFTPVAGAVMFTGRTVQATGLSIYRVGRTTVDIFAPSIEAGFLTGLGLLSAGTGALTYAGGDMLGLVNQVAFSSAAGVTAGVGAAGATVVEAGKYAALVSYDIGKGAAKVVINQAKSGVALGYNALTAIPAQLIIGIPNSIIFLAYDGPKLALVAVSGGFSESAGGQPVRHRVEDIPVGTVVDLEKLAGKKGVKVQVISEDPEVILPILNEAAKDLKSEGKR